MAEGVRRLVGDGDCVFSPAQAKTHMIKKKEEEEEEEEEDEKEERRKKKEERKSSGVTWVHARAHERRQTQKESTGVVPTQQGIARFTFGPRSAAWIAGL
jgi:hypothetical protein